MEPITVPWDQRHDHGYNKVPVLSDSSPSFALVCRTSTPDEQDSNWFGEFENGPNLIWSPLPAGDSLPFSDPSLLDLETQRLLDLNIWDPDLQMPELAVPQSEKLESTGRSELADTAMSDPTRRTTPSVRLEAVPEVSGPSAHSEESIAEPCEPLIWDSKTGQPIPGRSKRPLTTEDRAMSQRIRNLGGACAKCKKEKRKCRVSHLNRGTGVSPSNHECGKDSSTSFVKIATHKARRPISPPAWSLNDVRIKNSHLRHDGHYSETADATETVSWVLQTDPAACSLMNEVEEAPIAEQGSPANEAGSCGKPTSEKANASSSTRTSSQSSGCQNTGSQSLHKRPNDVDESGEVRIAKRVKKTAEEKELELRCPEYAAGKATLGKCCTFSSKNVDRLKSDHLKKDHGFTKDMLGIGRRKQGETEADLWQRLFIKLNPDWLEEHPSIPSPYVNPNCHLSEIAPFFRPTSFNEPVRPVNGRRNTAEVASAVDGGIFADETRRRHESQMLGFQLFPPEPTNTLGAPLPLTALSVPSTPYSAQVPQAPVAIAGNVHLNQSQAAQYQLFPSEQGNTLSARAPLVSLRSPLASHPLEMYDDPHSQNFQFHSDSFEAQPDTVPNDHKAPAPSASSGASNSDQSATTSIAPAPQCSDSVKSHICRCKRHEDSCKIQGFDGGEKCTGCDGFFTWSRKTEAFIKLGGSTWICRCKSHGKRCIKHREQYDAGKCRCCGGWFAFSDRADCLLKLPVLPREVDEFEEDFFSTMVDLKNSAP